MNTLSNANEFNELISNNKIVLFQFGSNSCSPCKSIKQKIEDYEVNSTDVTFIYVPVEKYQRLAASLTIFTVPTILVYVEGKLTIRKSGYFSLEEIILQLDKYILMTKSYEID